MSNQYEKSLDICLKIIERMASNSFQLKAWFLAAFSALLTFFAKWDTKVTADLIWVVPLFFFAGLDAYYLRQERIFRLVYDDFESQFNGGKVLRKPFDLKPTKEQRREYSLLNCFFSESIFLLYFPLVCVYWFFVTFQTMEQGWSLLVTLVSLPAVLLLCIAIFKKDSNHSKGAKSTIVP